MLTKKALKVIKNSPRIWITACSDQLPQHEGELKHSFNPNEIESLAVPVSVETIQAENNLLKKAILPAAWCSYLMEQHRSSTAKDSSPLKKKIQLLGKVFFRQGKTHCRNSKHRTDIHWIILSSRPWKLPPQKPATHTEIQRIILGYHMRKRKQRTTCNCTDKLKYLAL